jgi:hypothetical protein
LNNVQQLPERKTFQPLPPGSTGGPGHLNQQAKRKNQTHYSNMKNITKLAFIGATIASFGATALGDDSQLQNQLSLQRAQNQEASRVSTIAVYSNGKGVSRVTRDERPRVRFELRTNANGQIFGVYAAVE